MPSSRIELSHGRGGICGGSGIDRTKPAVLEPFMNNKDWEEFCQKVDVALEPANLATRISRVTFCATFLIFFIVLILSVVRTKTCFDNHSGYNSRGPNDCGPDSALFVLPVVMIFVSTAAFCVSAVVATVVQREIQRICQDASRRQPQLSFHVRYERHYYRRDRRSSTTQYIEVSMDGNNPPDTTVSTRTVIPMGDAVPIASAVVTDGSPAERLAELEKMKHLITPKEFETKRAEILASV